MKNSERLANKALRTIEDAKVRFGTGGDGYGNMMLEAQVYATLALIPDEPTPPGGYER